MADRTSASRHAARSRAAPYPSSRPGKRDPPLANHLKGPLSLFSGLYNFITRPWGSQSKAAQPEDAEEGGSQPITANPAAQRLSDRGVEMDTEAAQPDDPQRPEQQQPLRPSTLPAQQLPTQLPPPPRRRESPADIHSSPPRQQESTGEATVDNPLDAVSAFLAEKRGQTLNRVEYAGVVSLLQQSVADEEEKREPFRFSTSPAPPVPGPSTKPPRPPRMLSKNPNGVYKWNGAASAKPRRPQNRYASPGFGTPRSKSSIVLDLAPADRPEAKGKKRRTDEPGGRSDLKETGAITSTTNGNETSQLNQASTSSASSSAATSQPAPQVNGTSAPPTTPTRLRNFQANKPAVPSPLRQAWRAEPPSPPTTTTAVPGSSSSPGTRATRVASATLEILKEPIAKPEGKKRRGEFVNPYEGLAPPVKTAKKPPPPRRRRNVGAEKESAQGSKKQESSGAGSGQESGKTVQNDIPLSPQRIIEATVPKGAKRARPPPELVNADATAEAQPSLRRSARLKSPELTNGSSTSSFALPVRETPSIFVEDVEEVEELPKKKARTTSTVNGNRSAVTVEEVDDVDMPLSARPSSHVTPVVKLSQIVEPDNGSSSSAQTQSKSPSPPGPMGAPIMFGGMNGSANPSKFKSSAPKVSSKLRYSFQAEKEESGGEDVEVVEAKKGKDKGKGKEKQVVNDDMRGLDILSKVAAAYAPGAPKLSHATLPAASPSGRTEDPVAPSPFGAPASTSPFGAPTSTSPFGATSLASSGGAFASAFSTPSAPSISSTKDTPEALEDVKSAVKDLPVSELPTYNFELPLSSPGAGPSTLKAINEAKAAHVSSLPTYDFTASSSAETPKSISVAAPTTTGFNWAAAGMKKPAPPPANVWTCDVCSIQSPNTADKCIACEAPRPSAAPAKSTSTATTGGFNWAAAGMKKPSPPPADVWTCDVCAVKSPLTATKCIACETPRPGGASVKSTLPTTTGGFNWAAVGMKKPSPPSADVWTCDVCTIKSPLTANKCIACEAPRPGAAPKSTSTATTSGFNWAAAGMKKPSPPPADVWTCDVCSVKSPDTASKCIACETPRPGAASTSTATKGGFNWAAAGMKKPESSGDWECPSCLIMNQGTAKKCVCCETDR